jgi:hypothetical protein
MTRANHRKTGVRRNATGSTPAVREEDTDVAEGHQPEHMAGGVPYPTDYLAGAIDDATQAERAARALTAAGFGADDIVVLRPGEVVATMRIKAHHRGFFEKVLYPLERWGTQEGMHAGRYEQEALQGHTIVHVYTPEEVQMRQAALVLRHHSPHDL